MPNKASGKKTARKRSAKPKEFDSAADFEKQISQAAKSAQKSSDHCKYELRLYVAGVNPNSSRAIANVRKICEEHLAGRFELEVVDLYQNPVLSKGEQIVAVPTLIKKIPSPLRKFIGDMSDTDRILVGLDLRPKIT
jgi:circadian clock protein KaiB